MSAARAYPEAWEQLFSNATKRDMRWDTGPAPFGHILNLGAGNSHISGAVNLDRPDWEAPFLDYKDGSVAAIHAYHFLEHLDGDTVKEQISQVNRVLADGGLFYYAVPYAMAPIAYMDVDHKTFWTEETMRTLLFERGYASGIGEHWLEIYMQVIVGMNSQNLTVVGVLRKRVGD